MILITEKEFIDNSRLCFWMSFIKAEGEKELEALAKKDPLISKAVLRLMELSADEENRLLYEAREKQRMDLETLLDDARKQGQKELQGVIAEKDKSIADRDKSIADRDKSIADRDKEIAEAECKKTHTD